MTPSPDSSQRARDLHSAAPELAQSRGLYVDFAIPGVVAESLLTLVEST